MKCVLVSEFIATSKLNLSLFVLVYCIVNAYKYIDNDQFHPKDFITRIIDDGVMNDISSFVNYAEINYNHMTPFFWRRCVYGYKVFLDLYLLHNIYPVGTGTNCYHAHGGIISNPYQMMLHDLHHNQYFVTPNVESIGRDKFINWSIDLNILTIETIEHQGCIFLLYYLLHEASLGIINNDAMTLYGYKYRLLNIIINDFRSNRLYTAEDFEKFIATWIRDVGYGSVELELLSFQELYRAEISPIPINYEIFNRDYIYFNRLLKNCQSSLNFFNIYHILWNKFMSLYP